MFTPTEQTQAPYDEALVSFLKKHADQDYCPQIKCQCHFNRGYHQAITDALLMSDGDTSKIVDSFTTADPNDKDNVWERG